MSEAGYNLPDKLYFRIGEVSDLVGVKPYVLRYWETEFGDIKPTKSKSGQRLYKKRDVEMLLRIKDLLYSERFTISGAKHRLKELCKEEKDEIRHEEAAQQSMFDEAAVGDRAVGRGEEKAVHATDRKFLQKLKVDLDWCLKELKVE